MFLTAGTAEELPIDRSGTKRHYDPSSASMSSQWSTIDQKPPYPVSTMLLLTDGSVLVHHTDEQQFGTKHFSRLVPDATGSYAKGTWVGAPDLDYAPLYFVSTVLNDGRVFLTGGEYDGNAESHRSQARILDPLHLEAGWYGIPPVDWEQVGDAPSCALADGRVLLGSTADQRVAIYDPETNFWHRASDHLYQTYSDEETWILLPDQSVLAIDCYNPLKAARYDASQNQWIKTQDLPVDPVLRDPAHLGADHTAGEIGPAILLPNGKVLLVGGQSYLLLYDPPVAPATDGNWAVVCTLDHIDGHPVGAKDAPACLLPNGKVIFCVGPIDTAWNDYFGPAYFFLFDYQLPRNPPVRVPDPPLPNGQNFNPGVWRFLGLPSGEILLSNGTAGVAIYNRTEPGDPAWLPTVTKLDYTELAPGYACGIYGLQFNGLSQATGYGDDATAATNYPLVRIEQQVAGKSAVTYARTFDHSTMGVATGTIECYTRFSLSPNTPLGQGNLVLVANGIASSPTKVSIVDA